MGQFLSTKTFTYAEGLSVAFRQWRASHSHCQLIHGYAIQVELTFGANDLDNRNWVWDFGSTKPIKQFLKDMLDHTYAAAADDPMLDTFKKLHDDGLIDLRIVDHVGCEQFAKLFFNQINRYIHYQSEGRCWLEKCEVREHVGNSAIYSAGVEDRVYSPYENNHVLCADDFRYKPLACKFTEPPPLKKTV